MDVRKALAIVLAALAIGLILFTQSTHTPRVSEQEIELSKRGVLKFIIEDDTGVVDVPFFILPAAPPNSTLPDRITPTRGPAPQYVVDIIKEWTYADKIGVMAVVINGTDVAVGTVAVNPREIIDAIDRGETREIRIKIRGRINPGQRTPTSAACPEAVMVKEAEYQSDMIQIPLFRVRNTAGVYGTFAMFLTYIEKWFNFGVAIQEDIADLNVNFRIEAYAYTIGGSYSGVKSTTIPSSGDVVRAIYAWGKGRFEVYRIDYLTGGGGQCLVRDSDWLYRVYLNYIQTVSYTHAFGNQIVMEAADLSVYDAQVPGTVSIVYKTYTGTGASLPKHRITISELTGWFYQECPGSLTAPDVGAGIDLGKILARLSKVASRYAQVLELIYVDIAWMRGTQPYVIILGGISFDADSGKVFSAYLYTTQHKVTIPDCGDVDLPFIYIEFK